MNVTWAIEDIKKILPHRYPFLLVDRVTEIEKGKRIKGYKNVSVNESFFQGHFPQNPVMPGVLTIEALAQLGAILLLQEFPPGEQLAYFAGIDKARFKKVIVPGDRMDMEVIVLRFRGHFGVMEGKVFVDGQLATEATLLSAVSK